MKITVYSHLDCSESELRQRVQDSIHGNAGQLILSHDIDPDELEFDIIAIKEKPSPSNELVLIEQCDAIFLPDGWMCSNMAFGAWIAYDLNKILLFEKPSTANLAFLKTRKLQLIIHEATGVAPYQMIARTRKAEVVNARVLFYHYAKMYLGINNCEICEILNVDHSTLHHYARLYNDSIDNKTQYEFQKADSIIKNSLVG